MLNFIASEDIAYAAGLFEGEGWVGKHKGRNGWRLGINMTDLEPLQRMQKLLGGNILGPYDRSKFGSNKPIYSWTITGYRKIEETYILFKKYLSPRRLGQFEASLTIKPKNRFTSPDCGLASNNGYERHRRLREPSCIPCRLAHREYSRFWRSNRCSRS